jgi:hypothetical protein
MTELEPTDYAATLDELKRHVHEARYQAQRKVNTELLRLYWRIGATILDRQRTAGWEATSSGDWRMIFVPSSRR